MTPRTPCTCWDQAPTVPTYRGRMEHLPKCPLYGTGRPVGYLPTPDAAPSSGPRCDTQCPRCRVWYPGALAHVCTSADGTPPAPLRDAPRGDATAPSDGYRGPCGAEWKGVGTPRYVCDRFVGHDGPHVDHHYRAEWEDPDTATTAAKPAEQADATRPAGTPLVDGAAPAPPSGPSAEERANLRRLVTRQSPAKGGWRVEVCKDPPFFAVMDLGVTVCRTTSLETAEFIAAAPDALMALLAAVERLSTPHRSATGDQWRERLADVLRLHCGQDDDGNPQPHRLAVATEELIAAVERGEAETARWRSAAMDELNRRRSLGEMVERLTRERDEAQDAQRAYMLAAGDAYSALAAKLRAAEARVEELDGSAKRFALDAAQQRARAEGAEAERDALREAAHRAARLIQPADSEDGAESQARLASDAWFILAEALGDATAEPPPPAKP